MILGESLEDYLESIVILSKAGKVRSTDVAQRLSVSKPSVNKAMNNLKEKGLITQESYGDIKLTKKGEEVANMIHNRHQIIHDFLLNALGVSEENAEKDACRIEHVISEETFQKIIEFENK